MFISRCMRGTLYDWLSFGDQFHLNDEAKGFITIFLKGLVNANDNNNQKE